MEVISVEKKENKKQVIYWVIATLIYILIAVSLINENESIMTVAVLASIIYVVFSDISSSLMLLVGITVFENSFKISGNLAWFYLLVVILLKRVVQKGFRISTHQRTALFATTLLAIIAFFTDTITYGVKGQMLTTFVLVIYMGTMFDIDSSELNITARRIVIYLGTSFVCAIIYVLAEYGNVSAFINSFMASAYAYRFGLSFGDTIGGAMAIPLYSLLIISFSIYCLIEEKTDFKFLNIPIIVLDIVSVAIGALTISRSFYLGLILIFATFIVGRSKREGSFRKKIILIVVIVLVGAIALNLYEDIINQSFNNLFSRITNDQTGGSGGRTQIWASCISYLFSNPIGLITGYGSNGYPIIGLTQGYLFSAGAHNLYLDIIMSWGLVGFICVILISSQYRPVNGFSHIIRNKTLAALPLLTLLFFCTTAMRTNSMKTVIYYFSCFYVLKIAENTD